MDALAVASEWTWGWVKYEIIEGNELWRFGALLLLAILSMAIGRSLQHIITKLGAVRENQKHVAHKLILVSLAKPAYVLVIAIGFSLARYLLVFESRAEDGSIIQAGINPGVFALWQKSEKALFAIVVAYAMFHLVDVIEFYLHRATRKTDTTLDDMLVPVIRKALRIIITIISILYVVEHTVGTDKIKTFVVSAGIGGIAIALAAKDTLANFFGSVTIFADRPFHIKELIKINGYTGTVEEVGLRSTKLRTLEGHLVTVPNSTIADSFIENVHRRKFIRRTANITITYDSGHEKAEKAVNIIREILASMPEINADENSLPKVYFDDFNDWSLNIYMTYWVSPADWWLFKEVAQRINLEMMKRFEEAGIEFAFPSQTLYINKDSE